MPNQVGCSFFLNSYFFAFRICAGGEEANRSFPFLLLASCIC